MHTTTPWPSKAGVAVMTRSHRAEGQIPFWILVMNWQWWVISYSKMYITGIYTGNPDFRWHYYPGSAFGSLRETHDPTEKIILVVTIVRW